VAELVVGACTGWKPVPTSQDGQAGSLYPQVRMARLEACTHLVRKHGRHVTKRLTWIMVT
jgi:hypothetical protein